MVEELAEERFSRDCDKTRSPYESLRESLYLHRSRFIDCGSNDGEHIQKGVSCQEYVQSTRTIPQFFPTGAGSARAVERTYRSGRHLRMAHRRLGSDCLRLRGGWECKREEWGVGFRSGAGGTRNPGWLDRAAPGPTVR